MPELPEVENFRRLLLPLVSSTSQLTFECPSDSPPRSFLSPQEIESLNGNCRVKDILRKGKLICMVLECITKVQDKDCVYLFLHMGMTGRISTPSHVPSLESLTNNADYPPAHTHLLLKTGEHQAAFSDPRKFGSVTLCTTKAGFDALAPDALDFDNIEGLVQQSTGIKAILLDQKRVMSGVGNWVADEVLYQSRLHPEQTYLTNEQATALREKIHSVLATAIDCLDQRKEFPDEWLFHRRWLKRSAANGVKDAEGRNVTFVKAAGRTSAIVPSIQTKRQSQANANKKQKIDTQRNKSSPKVSSKKTNSSTKKKMGWSQPVRRSSRLSTN